MKMAAWLTNETGATKNLLQERSKTRKAKEENTQATNTTEEEKERKEMNKGTEDLQMQARRRQGQEWQNPERSSVTGQAVKAISACGKGQEWQNPSVQV